MSLPITEWGGYSYGNSLYIHIGDRWLWTIDPFLFLKRALRLDMELIPDPTTEGGRRVLFVHIDGDGSNPSALQSLIDRIFEIYRVPHSISGC